MAYQTDKKSTGLDVLTGLDAGDLHIVGDVSDSGRAKAITQNNLEIDIANSNNFVDTLVANSYFTTELAGDTNFITNLQTAGVGSTVDVQLNGVSVENPVDTINFIAPSGTVTTPTAGLVDVDLSSLIGGGAGGGGTKLAIDTNEVSNSTTTPVTAFTIPIPGGTLGTNDAIRFRIGFNKTINPPNYPHANFSVTYGGQSVGGGWARSGGSECSGLIIADNSTSAQKTQFVYSVLNGGSYDYVVSTGSLTVDSSIDNDLVVSIYMDSGSSGEITAEFIVVEKISDGNDVNNIEFFDDFINNVKTSADSSTERGVSGNFIIEDISGADPAYVALGSSETNHPGIVTLTTTNGGELYGFTNADSGFTSTETRTIPIGNDFNFSGLFRSVRPGASFSSIFGLCIDGASGVSGGVYARFNNSTSATKIVFYDGAVQTTTAINLPTSNAWTTFEIDWVSGTSTLTFKIGGTTVYSGTPTFTGTHVGFYAGTVGGTAGTSLDFDYITTNYKITR